MTTPTKIIRLENRIQRAGRELDKRGKSILVTGWLAGRLQEAQGASFESIMIDLADYMEGILAAADKA